MILGDILVVAVFTIPVLGVVLWVLWALGSRFTRLWDWYMGPPRPDDDEDKHD